MEKKKKRDNGRVGTKHNEETKLDLSKKLLGNNNAEKYTENDAIDFILNAIAIAESFSYDFIGEVADHQGVDRILYNYLSKKFKTVEILVNRLKGKCETNCFKHAKKGDIVASLAIINLKSNHNWTDRVSQNTDVTSGGQPLQMNNLITFINSDDNEDEETDE